MRTSEQWWKEVSSDEARLKSWLKKQYHGELMAYQRIISYLDEHRSSLEQMPRVILDQIAHQELDHAYWIAELLETRGIEPAYLGAHDARYWEKTLAAGEPDELEAVSAVAAHAERMRLERIRVIAADESAPADIRSVFQKILPQEVFHEKAFKMLSTDEHMAKALQAHMEGVEALGLIQVAEVL